MDSYCVILTTTGNHTEADRLAELLVSRHLAACVQIANIPIARGLERYLGWIGENTTKAS